MATFTIPTARRRPRDPVLASLQHDLLRLTKLTFRKDSANALRRILTNKMNPAFQVARRIWRTVEALEHRRNRRARVREYRGKRERSLEIGPGPHRMPDFETLDLVDRANVDYICNAAKTLPFEDGTFDLIYASHVLEHVPWYQTEEVLREWVRVMKAGGRLEIWVPNGLKICKAFLDAELEDNNYIDKDGWYRLNEERDPCKWAAGRIFTYGDGQGTLDHPNWHRAIFSPRYLRMLMENAGLSAIRELDRSEVRGHDHGWISLGMTGCK